MWSRKSQAQMTWNSYTSFLEIVWQLINCDMTRAVWNLNNFDTLSVHVRLLSFDKICQNLIFTLYCYCLTVNRQINLIPPQVVLPKEFLNLLEIDNLLSVTSQY